MVPATAVPERRKTMNKATATPTMEYVGASRIEAITGAGRIFWRCPSALGGSMGRFDPVRVFLKKITGTGRL
jgi:hypothetical protein